MSDIEKNTETKSTKEKQISRIQRKISKKLKPFEKESYRNLVKKGIEDNGNI